MSHDMMPHFELYQPDTLENALELAKESTTRVWFMAGGNDSLDWFKDRAKRPGAVIDIAGIASLKGIRETAEGLEIGALTTLAEIENDKTVREKYSLLAQVPQAASRARRSATPARSAATSARTRVAGTTATA